MRFIVYLRMFLGLCDLRLLRCELHGRDLAAMQVLRHLGQNSLRGYGLVDLEVPHPFDML